jgi:hypothetical protein
LESGASDGVVGSLLPPQAANASESEKQAAAMALRGPLRVDGCPFLCICVFHPCVNC